jgi:hypothetical protein
MNRTITHHEWKVFAMVSQENLAVDSALRGTKMLTGIARDGLLNECTQQADEIILLLEEESTALRTFNSEVLMQLLGKKEHLFGKFKERIESLAAEKDSGVAESYDPERAPLRDRLHRIALLNQGNRAFIENTLSYYQDFLNCLCPCVYSRGQEGRPERTQVSMRGVAFKKEM